MGVRVCLSFILHVTTCGIKSSFHTQGVNESTAWIESSNNGDVHVHVTEQKRMGKVAETFTCQLLLDAVHPSSEVWTSGSRFYQTVPYPTNCKRV